MKNVHIVGITADGRREPITTVSYGDDEVGTAREYVLANARQHLAGVLTPYVAVELSGDINLTLHKSTEPRQAYSEQDNLAAAREAAQWFYENEPFEDEAALQREATKQAYDQIYGEGGLTTEFFNVPAEWEALYQSEFIAEYHRLENSAGD